MHLKFDFKRAKTKKMGRSGTKNLEKHSGQGIVEFCITFILTVFTAFFILEFAIYLQNLHSVQTFNDEINANLVLYKDLNICSSGKSDVLDLMNFRAQKYLERGLELSYKKNTKDVAEFESNKVFLGKNVLNVEIICNASDENFITRSTYLYRGLFIFKGGRAISSLSSIQTPKF